MDELNASLEAIQIPFGLYIKKFIVYRINELNNKRVILDEDFLLPKNSTFHFLDNFFQEDRTIDTPPIKEEYIYLKDRMPRKKIFHNKEFPREGIFAVNKHFRYVTTGINLEIIKFNREYKKLLLPLNDYREPDGELVLQLINHNPLSRVKFSGVLQHYDKFEAMFSSVLNTIKRNNNRIHFLPIKVNTNLFMQDFNSIIQTNRLISPTLKKDNMYYYLVIHIVLYLLNRDNELSLFSRFPEEEINNINFIFYNSQKPANSIIYNLKYLAALCENKVKVLRFITALNSLFYNVEAPEDIELIEAATNKSDIVEVAKIENPDVIDKSPTISEIKEEVQKTEDKVEEEKIKKIMDKKDPEEFEDFIHERLKDKVDVDKIITPIQKEVAIDISKNYKKIPVTIDGKITTIGDVLKQKRTVDVKASILSEELKEKLIDPSMVESTLKEYDSIYMKKLFYPDLFETFLSFQSNGLLLHSFEEKNEYNELNRVKHIRVTLVSTDKKRHTLNLKLPIPDDEGYFMINGVKTIMTKQLVSLPICQVSPTRVNLVSNYNKTIVEKKISSANNFTNIVLAALKANPEIQFDYSSGVSYKEIKVPSEYSSIGKRINNIRNENYHLFFNQNTILNDLNLKEEDVKYFTQARSPLILIGRDLNKKDTYLFMDFENRVRIINIKKTEDITNSTLYLNDIIFGNKKIKTSFEHCDLKILDQNIPIIFVLGYKYGLKNTLDYLKVNYRLVDKTKEKLELQPNELSIQFKDRTLVYNKYPIKNSLIVNGLFKYPTLNRYNINELNKPDVYYNLIIDKGLSANYLIGIYNFFDFFVDSITRHILLSLNEPTNSKDLLVRAVDLLTTEDHKDVSENIRIRGFERLNSMIYNEIARQYANYSNSHYKEKSFSINTEAIFQRIIQDQTVTLAEEINPIHVIKEAERVTYSGFGGRSSESFVEKDRAFSKANLGVLSEATPDSGAVGISRFLSGNPGIKNARGLLTKDNTDSPTNLLSTTSLLMPFSTCDDAKRANFINIQLSHHVPCINSKPARVRTGLEMLIPHKTTSAFAYTARQDGKIVSIDDDLKLVKVRYKDSSEDIFSYKSDMASASGTYIKKDFKLTDKVRIGKSVKEGDVLCYHTGFFSEEDGVVSWNHGVFAKIAILETDITNEDSNCLSRDLSKKLVFDSLYLKDIKITSDMVITKIVDIGDDIKFDDDLCTLEYPEIEMLNIKELDPDIEADDILMDLKSIRTRSKHEGKIFDIEIFRTCELKDMHPSIAKVVRKIEKTKVKKMEFSKGTSKEDKYTPSGRLEAGIRIKGHVLEENTILICFYISHDTSCGVGDKVVFDSSLKSVVAQVVNNPFYSKSGKKIDGLFSGSSIYNRIILSPIKTGLISGNLEKVEENIIDMWFNEDKLNKGNEDLISLSSDVLYDEEILDDEEEEVVSLSALDSSLHAKKEYITEIDHVYHYVSNGDVNDIKKMGLCSPRYLYENYPDIFKDSSFKIWEDRVKKFLKKDEVTPEEVLKYLDNIPKNKGKVGSKTLFFTFLPISFYDKEIQKAFKGSVQCKIPVSILKDKTPFLIYKGKINKSTWKEILDDDFHNQVIEETKNKAGKFLFSNITHLASDINHIPGKSIELSIF